MENEKLMKALAEALLPYLLPYISNAVKDELLAIEESKPKENEGLLTKAEVRGLLKVSDATLWRWDKRRLLEPIRLGQKVLYRKDDVENFTKKK